MVGRPANPLTGHGLLSASESGVSCYYLLLVGVDAPFRLQKIPSRAVRRAFREPPAPCGHPRRHPYGAHWLGGATIRWRLAHSRGMAAVRQVARVVAGSSCSRLHDGRRLATGYRPPDFRFHRRSRRPDLEPVRGAHRRVLPA